MPLKLIHLIRGETVFRHNNNVTSLTPVPFIGKTLGAQGAPANHGWPSRFEIEASRQTGRLDCISMNIIERITEHLREPPLNEDGEPFGLTLMRGLSDETIASREREFGCTFNNEVRALLSHCGGFEGVATEWVHFDGAIENYSALPRLKGRMREISPDGYGNFWFQWGTSVNADLGPIYYYMHEGPMLIYQCDGIVEFVKEYLRFMTPPYDSLLDDVHEFRLKPTQDLNLDLIERAKAVESADATLSSFAASMPEECSIYDFRGAKPGDGIDLLNLEIVGVRPKEPILAVARRRGLFERIFSAFKNKK